MPRQTEQNANNALGILLQSMFSRSRVYYENTRVIVDHPGLQPDILITSNGRSPVVVEAEYMPAANVEPEARERLGLDVTVDSRPIEAAIALRYPKEVSEAASLADALKGSTLSYCVFTQERNDVKRFPESGWLDGSVEDLADLVRLVSVPQWAVDAATEILRKGIDNAAKILDETATYRPETVKDIAARLGMIDVTQTRRMACAIMANAMVFHERISKMHPGIKTLEKVCGEDVANPQHEVLASWDAILKINYWPIFAIARDILSELQSGDAARILRRLRDTAQEINSAGVENAHDLTGRIFQNLIADRKYLATFYTLPASAALLARLAVAKMKDVDWSNKEAIGKLRIADFACGTGTLLSAVYEQIAARHERAGGNPADLHSVMMEEVLYGCDVMPSAVHITCSTLSGMEPAEGFGKSRLYALQYGRQEDGTVKIGSLEFLQTSAQWTLFNTSDPATQIGSSGEEIASQAIANMPDQGFDLVVMNPPFTRPTNHAGKLANVVNPAFAAFDTTSGDQTKMGGRINSFGRGTCYRGNAGMASAFVALADKKLKPGGVIALVLPLVSVAGLSWQGFRQMLARHYTDLMILSIAADGINDLSFSADTGLGECLVIARKIKETEQMPTRAVFASLTSRPQGFAHASSLSGSIVNQRRFREIEDGPYGGTPIIVGDSPAGWAITAPCHQDGRVWGAVRIADYSVAQTVYALSDSKLWLPGISGAMDINVVPFNKVGKLGLVHRDITGPAPRGPFDKDEPSPTATYPALWNHDAKLESYMVCSPDSQLHVRQGMENKASEVWATATRSHINLEFRFNSQPLTVAFTDEVSIGGRSWPNVRFGDARFDLVFTAWGNSTLGFLSHWYHSSRQDAGRGGSTIRSVESLPILDFRTLTDEQLVMAEMIFDEFRDKELFPAYLADADPNRALLDRRVICDLLGFDEEIYQGVRRLAAKWCAEPSVHGGKKRPAWAKFIA